MEALQSIDAEAFRYINDLSGHPSLDFLMLFLSAHTTWIVLATLFLAWVLVRRRLDLGKFVLMLAMGVGLSDVVCFKVLKPSFARSRPCYHLEEVQLVQGRCGGDYGFPSNHAANGMAVAVIAALQLRNLLVLVFFGLAVAVGFSRIYLGVHYPGDVLMGFLVGAGFGSVVYVAVNAGVRTYAKHHRRRDEG